MKDDWRKSFRNMFFTYEDVEGNFHVKDDYYSIVAEIIRQEHFLPAYGFSDDWFNEKGWQQIRVDGYVHHERGIETGHDMRVNLEFYVEPRLWFHMVFDFVRPDGNLAAKMYTNDIFKKNSGGIWLPARRVPQFFIEKIRNV